MLLLCVGTGSAFSLDKSNDWRGFIESRTQLEVENLSTIQIHVDVRSVIQHLDNIRGVLNLSITELAPFFEVSRQAIYKWLSEDSVPESGKLEQIQNLSKVADAFHEAGVSRAGAMLQIKGLDGQSLLDLLKTGKPYEKQLKDLIAEAEIRKTAYSRSGLEQSKAPKTNDWLSSFAIPTYREEL